MTEIAATSYSAVGRKYGVSDNAIRKWVRAYEREHGDQRERADEPERAPPLAA
jgi:transposase-like protein